MSEEVEEKEFLAENEVMDLSKLREKTFAVAVSTGDSKSVKFLCTTLHGPYTFVEMVQEIGDMWVNHQHHGRPIILEKDVKARVRALDANTIDYIEANYNDIIIEETLTGVFDDKVFTCEAGYVFDEPKKGRGKVITWDKVGLSLVGFGIFIYFVYAFSTAGWHNGVADTLNETRQCSNSLEKILAIKDETFVCVNNFWVPLNK